MNKCIKEMIEKGVVNPTKDCPFIKGQCNICISLNDSITKRMYELDNGERFSLLSMTDFGLYESKGSPYFYNELHNGNTIFISK